MKASMEDVVEFEHDVGETSLIFIYVSL